MADAATVPFSGLSVKLESETTPGTYAAPCGLTERSISFTKEVNDTLVPDCEDEDAASWPERDVTSKSVTISGEGVMARQSLARWRAAWESDEPVSARVDISGNVANGGGNYTGLFHLTSFELGATKGERCTVSVEMQSTGRIPFTAATA